MRPEMIIAIVSICFVVLVVVCLILFANAYRKYKRVGTADIESQMREQILGISSAMSAKDEEDILARLSNDFSRLNVADVRCGTKELLEEYLDSLSNGKILFQKENISDKLGDKLSKAVKSKVLLGISDIVVGEVSLVDYIKEDGFAKLVFRAGVDYITGVSDLDKQSRHSNFDILVIYTSGEQDFWMYADISAV